MATTAVPVEIVRGPDEVTVWFWPNTADPLTVRVDRDEWESYESELGETDCDSMEEFVGEAVAEDLLNRR